MITIASYSLGFRNHQCFIHTKTKLINLSFSPAQALSFAPDAATARKGEDLAILRKWRNLSGNPRVIWGECKSSDGSFYKTQLDFSGPAFKCNCPSRKFPCKHAIGLFLLYIENADDFRVTHDYPEWMREWLEKRGINPEENSVAQKEAELKNRELRLKNRDARVTLMASGAEDLEIWLNDLIRQGLATTEGQAYSYWQSIAARMVDSKLGGVGKRIRKFPLLHNSGTEWPERMMSELGQLYLIVKGFENLEDLPPILQTELLTVAGVNIKKDEVLAQKGISDDWLVIGVIEGVDENLNFRHTWLYGSKSEQIALILEYVFGDAGYPVTWQVGQAFNGEIVYFPAAHPLRALVKTQKGAVALFDEPRGYVSLERFFDNYSKALAQNPWIYDFPCYLEEVTPVIEKGKLYMVDNEKKYLEALPRDNIAWKLVALSGGNPISIFGEWSGEYMIPLSVIIDGNVVAL
jgi:SWIM zinc finger